jgi:capsular polysaccharide biosynthesis protein
MSDIKVFLNRVGRRMQKYWFVLLLIPIITAAVSYFVNDNEDQTADPQEAVVKLYVEINLGDFDSLKYNTSTEAVDYIKSTNFLTKVINQYNLEVELVELKDNLIVSPSGENSVVLSYTSQGRENAEKILTPIANTFYKESLSQYNNKMQLVKKSIESLQNQEVAQEDFVEKEEFLYELQEKGIYWEEPVVSEPFGNEESIQATEVQRDPIQNILLGLLVGIILSLFGIFIPEIFRDKVK